MIEVTALSKQYGEFTALKHVSFTALPAQVTGFLGPNGAGKTTTMRILAGYLPPTSGTAQIVGYDVFEQSLQVRQNVGYLPETVPLYRDMTVLSYLMYLGEIRRLSNCKQRAYNALEKVGMTHRAKSRIRTLSKGMRQRIGLASVIIHNPPVLILDEPTIGLDPLQVIELRDLIRDLGREHTVLFSTHILAEAEQVCDDIVIINQGQIVTQGSPQALRDTWVQGGRILIRIDADLPSVQKLLEQQSMLESVTIENDALILTPQSDIPSINIQVTQLLAQENIPLIEIRPLATTLEDIFIEATRQTNA